MYNFVEEAATRTLPYRPRIGAQEAPDGDIAVWLLVTANDRPRRMKSFVRELADPEFVLASCRESARLDDGPGSGYAAHWYCRFAREAQDPFAELRLLKRLVGAGFRILQFDGEIQN